MWCLLLTFPELLVGGGLLVPCFLPGPPVIKQLMQMVTMVPDQGGQFQSVTNNIMNFFLDSKLFILYIYWVFIVYETLLYIPGRMQR